MLTTRTTTLDQFVLHLAMELMGAPKLLNKLQKSFHKDDSKSGCLPLRLYWRSPVIINKTENMTSTTTHYDSDKEPMYFVDVTFDFNSTSPLAIFGVLVNSSKLDALYYKSLPLTLNLLKRHLEGIGVDVEQNDVSVMAKSMAQALQQVTRATVAHDMPTVLVLDLEYQDLGDTGRLELSVQQPPSQLDTTCLDLILCNVTSFDEALHEKSNESEQHNVSPANGNGGTVKKVLALWRQRTERIALHAAMVAASTTKNAKEQENNGEKALVVVAQQPNDEFATSFLPSTTLGNVDLTPADTANTSPTTVATALNTTSTNTCDDGNTTTITSNNNNKSSVVKRVVATSTKSTRQNKRRKGGERKLTYANP